jgi:tetratricopeptide repeat protein 21B
VELLTDLANLFLRLNNTQAAMQVLNDALSRKITDMSSLRLAVESHHLLFKVILHTHKGEDPLNITADSEASTALQNSITLQKDVLSRGRDMPADQMEEERRRCSTLLYEMGEYCQDRAKDLDNAASFYSEAMSYQEMYPKPIVALAKLNLRKGDYSQATHFCHAMLRNDPSNEEATNMIAELLLQQNQVDQAITHYSNLIKNKPDNYMTLARLLQLFRRAGRVEAIDTFIQQAEASRVKGAEAGLSYCKGLAAWFKGNIQEALEKFNNARSSAQYGKYSLSAMVTAYLNPENDPFWSVLTSAENLSAASALFEELRSRYYDLNTVILECYYKTLSGRSDQALTQLQVILTNNPSYVPAIVAQAIAMLAHNKSSDVRNTLKNLNKIPYYPEYAEDFERGWLLLGDIYSDGGNPELATELLSKCLKYNANCSKAEELLGQIYERKQNHADACRHYEKAWKLNMSGSIGYRLAFNYLKAKRYVKAVDICRAVLKKYPDYPQIQSEVLSRARASIRL